MRNKVTVSLTGGLGNQMFQYSAGRALSLRLSLPLLLDISWFRRRFNPNVMTSRMYELSVFPNLQNQDLVNRLPLPTAIQNIASLAKGEHILHDTKISTVKFSSIQTRKHLRLTGYWQNVAYFESIRETLCSDFSLNYTSLQYANPELPQLDSGSTLGIHVRRGDYVSLPTTIGSNQTLDVTYYDNAIDLVMSRHKISKIVIVSDDVEWCQRHFNGNIFIIASAENSSMEDFAIFHTCDHHIISNSSFSWWAAWLKQEPDQTVIAPTQWHPDGSGFKSIPNRWTAV